MSWVLLGSVGLHIVANFRGFKHHLGTRCGQLLIGAFAAPVRALAEAPLAILAEVARLTPGELQERLSAAGLEASSDRQSLSELTGPDLRRQIEIMSAVFSTGE